MTAFCHLLRFLAAASLGVFVGATLAEGLVLVPYWRSLPPGEFFRWYAANAQRLLSFFGPVTSLAAVLSVAAAVASLWEGHPRRWHASVAAVLTIAVVSMFFLYFERANASFAAASIGAAELPAELSRWSSWHWLRTGLALGAFAAALLTLRTPPDGRASAGADR
jgi:type IV secretory pathway VirB2 component (pilin)